MEPTPLSKRTSRAPLLPASSQTLSCSQKDPRKVPPDTIKDIAVEATYLGGEKVYTAPPKPVAMIPQPPINYGDGDYGDGDE